MQLKGHHDAGLMPNRIDILPDFYILCYYDGFDFDYDYHMIIFVILIIWGAFKRKRTLRMIMNLLPMQSSQDIYVSATDISGSALCFAVRMVQETALLLSNNLAFVNFPGGDAAPLRVYSRVFLLANISQSNTHPGCRPIIN